MKCPSCDCHDTRVIDSRETSEMDAVRRRRQCVACGKRFTTYERYERPDLRVRKRDGSVEDFDRDKLELGILKAVQKRPISRDDVSKVVDRIEEELRALDEVEVPSTEIGAIVLESLKRLDPVAYMRFASVYKEFPDVEHFEREIKALKQQTLDGKETTPAPPLSKRKRARRVISSGE